MNRTITIGAVLSALVLTVQMSSVPPALAASAWEDCDQSADLDRVVQACTEVIAEEGNPNRAYSERCRYEDKHEYDRAIADCSEAIELDPKIPLAYHYRCQALVQKKDYDRGITDCDKAVELDPNFAKRYGNRCGAYFEKGDYDRAIADCDKAVELDPTGLGFCGTLRRIQRKTRL
jgi:tetratricopeptide (TPR) repeat protein